MNKIFGAMLLFVFILLCLAVKKNSEIRELCEERGGYYVAHLSGCFLKANAIKLRELYEK